MAYMMIKDNPDMALKEVAHNFGFYDEFHFSKLFKKRYGFSPSELKKSADTQGKENTSVGDHPF